MAKFSVDTHLFRELGELLVGRNSTAIAELIKNSYDADATEVILYGENLDKPRVGRIVITDNGVGMTMEIFEKGFLTIASRIKETGSRRSPYYQRRFTGAKGVGRLAAQKLAWRIDIMSVSDPAIYEESDSAIIASIDWEAIDRCQTLDDPSLESAIRLDATDSDDQPGTEIVLTRLRGKWTPRERSRVIHEVTTFQPPNVLVSIPKQITKAKLLMAEPVLRDVVDGGDPGFEVRLEGDFDVGEEYWNVVANAADWILEIVADGKKKVIDYCVTPTRTLLKSNPGATQHKFRWNGPKGLDQVPSAQARILIREGAAGTKDSRRWLTESSGIRVYMEGFRVLPYGEKANDWLEIDHDYTRRTRSLRFLEDAKIDLAEFGQDDSDFALSALRNSSYFGAVFLTNNGASDLRMVVNREGFQPDATYFNLQRIIRVGVDLSVRARAYETLDSRRKRRDIRSKGPDSSQPVDRYKMREAAETSVKKATSFAKKARSAAAAGKHKEAEKLIKSAALEIERGSGIAGELVTDRSIMQILAGVGLQMAAFVHEMNALLGMALAIEQALENLRNDVDLSAAARKSFARVAQNIGDLRRVVERQASYLSDVTSPDSRRRRSRQKLRDKVQGATQLVERAATGRKLKIVNKVPIDLKSPAMFPAELTIVMTNLLSNAIKACNKGGTVRIDGGTSRNGTPTITIQNTGTRVSLRDSEKWFLPFKSSSVESDPLLGQGMGMGLPIVRNILEEYGASIRFVKPRGSFATSLSINFGP